MLLYRRTSMLESSAQTLVNTVNCVGVMGKGVALEFKLREPKMFAAYKRICARRELSPGKLWLWRGDRGWVLNFPTKINWRNPSQMEWIEAGLEKFISGYERLGIREISFPRLGCGNGGLDWNDVRPVMEKFLAPLPIDVYVHDFAKDIGLPEHLEKVAGQMKAEAHTDPTFAGFIKALERALTLSDEKLEDILSREPISAQFLRDELVIEVGKRSWVFDEEALRGVWVSLQKGLLTQDKAGWTVSDGGQFLLSLLSVLPQVRPVEIQRAHTLRPELAIELRPFGSEVAVAFKAQQELSWH